MLIPLGTSQNGTSLLLAKRGNDVAFLAESPSTASSVYVFAEETDAFIFIVPVNTLEASNLA
jgi:hypothetical protein